MVIEEATPTEAQVAFLRRPPQEAADAPEPKASGPAKPLAVGPFNVVHIRFRSATGDIVPAMLCTPKDGKGPFPLVIAVHGLTSNKAQVCAQVGPALAAKGFAVLAADLPCHGERPGQPLNIFEPQKSFVLWRKAVIEVRQLIDLAEGRPEIDLKPGVVLAGYSLGSWISSIAGPTDKRIKAMVLMVGGALDIPALALLSPEIAATDPREALPHFAGRPIFFLNGKNDRIVAPESSRRLFAAAAEPKKQKWYECGHLLTSEAYTAAAAWAAEVIGQRGP
jgi:pimeloyl-ACP methyl ester carboxylesterase